MAQLCRDKAERMADIHKSYGWDDPCGDVDNIRGLSPLLRRHASEEEIREYIGNMDTACREQIPKMIWDSFR